MSWEYESMNDDNVLLDNVLQTSACQEKPIVPAIAQLLEKKQPEDDLHLYITPTCGETSPEVTLGSECSLEVPSIHLQYPSEDPTESISPSQDPSMHPHEVYESSPHTNPFQSLAQPFFTPGESEDEADKSTLEKLLDSLDEEYGTKSEEEQGIPSQSESVGSYLDSEGYFKEPARKICRYKRGKRSIIVGNTSAPNRKSLPQKRKSDVDITTLLDGDNQSISWSSSMESTQPARPATPDLFDSD